MIRPRSAFRFSLAILLAACGLACSARSEQEIPPPVTYPTGPDWTMYQGSAAHGGYVPVTLDPAAFSELYLRSLDTWPLNPVACAGNWVYVTNDVYGDDGKIYALNSGSGSLMWSQNIGNVIYMGPPAYSKGRVFTARSNQGDYNLFAFAYDTGEQDFITIYDAENRKYYAPTIYDDFLYVPGYGYLFALSATTGLFRWGIWLQDNSAWTPAVDAQHVYAYNNRPLAQLTVLNRDTGTPEFAIPDSQCRGGWSDLEMAPVIGALDDVLVINPDVDQSARLVSFDLTGRTIAYEIEGQFAGQLTLANGTIYVLNGGEVEARREADGVLLWNWAPPVLDPPLTPKGPIVAVDNLLFVSCQEPPLYLRPQVGVTYAIDLQTHEAVWTYPQFGHLALSAQNKLFIATRNGQLAAIRLK